MSASAKSTGVLGMMRVAGAAAGNAMFGRRSLRPAIDAAAALWCDQALRGGGVCANCRADARAAVYAFLVEAPALQLCSTAELARFVLQDGADA